jgi:hypothetical protein
MPGHQQAEKRKTPNITRSRNACKEGQYVSHAETQSPQRRTKPSFTQSRKARKGGQTKSFLLALGQSKSFLFLESNEFRKGNSKFHAKPPSRKEKHIFLGQRPTQTISISGFNQIRN